MVSLDKKWRVRSLLLLLLILILCHDISAYSTGQRYENKDMIIKNKLDTTNGIQIFLNKNPRNPIKPTPNSPGRSLGVINPKSLSDAIANKNKDTTLSTHLVKTGLVEQGTDVRSSADIRRAVFRRIPEDGTTDLKKSVDGVKSEMSRTNTKGNGRLDGTSSFPTSESEHTVTASTISDTTESSGKDHEVDGSLILSILMIIEGGGILISFIIMTGIISYNTRYLAAFLEDFATVDFSEEDDISLDLFEYPRDETRLDLVVSDVSKSFIAVR